VTEAHTHIDAALFDSMSAELQTWPQWVIWKHEQHPGEPKPRKVPYSPRGHRAKTNRSVTWGTFAEALAAYQRGGFDGIGFVFTASDPFAGIDLDGCRDPNTGRLEPWGAEIVRALNGCGYFWASRFWCDFSCLRT
jgi:primase-polymerase (primpol)-like protein